jgi:hypothetical protein
MLGRDVGIVGVIVVEADLTDGDAERVLGEGSECSEGIGSGGGGLCGVNAGAGDDVGRASRGMSELQRAVHGRRPVADADGKEHGDASVGGAGQDGGEVVVVVKVAVGVGEKHAVPL